MNELVNYYKTIEIMKSFIDNNKQENKKNTRDLEILELITNFHIFELEPKIKEALLRTKNNINEHRNLPFPKVFLDCELELDGFFIYGLLLYDMDLIKKDDLELSNYPLDHDIILSGYAFNSNDIRNETQASLAHVFFALRTADKFESKSISEKSRIKLREFVVNFIDFINNPEVELVTTRRTDEQNKKRVMRGKIPIPSAVSIKLNGILKQYLNQFVTGQQHKGFSHRFWIRGHFRNLKSQRYKESKGKKIWILPYIKGQGFLIKKKYDIQGDVK